MSKDGREPDETMQLKVPDPVHADETVMLRVVGAASTDQADTASGAAKDGSAPDGSRRRRRAPGPPP